MASARGDAEDQVARLVVCRLDDPASEHDQPVQGALSTSAVRNPCFVWLLVLLPASHSIWGRVPSHSAMSGAAVSLTRQSIAMS